MSVEYLQSFLKDLKALKQIASSKNDNFLLPGKERSLSLLKKSFSIGMEIVWTQHAEERQQQWEQRLGITQQEVEAVTTNPEQVIPDDEGILIAQSRRGNGLLRVPSVEIGSTKRILTVNMNSFNQVLESALQLTYGQQEMLIKILQNRYHESRRTEIAMDAQQTLDDSVRASFSTTHLRMSS
ncbi:hypothetical protein [Phormidesmis priestleyi]